PFVRIPLYNPEDYSSWFHPSLHRSDPLRGSRLIDGDQNQERSCGRSHDVQRPLLTSITADQTTWATTVLRIILNDSPRSNRLQNLLKNDFLFGHLLLSMLSDAKSLPLHLLADRPEQRINIGIFSWHLRSSPPPHPKRRQRHRRLLGQLSGHPADRLAPARLARPLLDVDRLGTQGLRGQPLGEFRPELSLAVHGD